PIASAIAGIALSASLCWGLQQQTDEIIPKVEEEYWHVVTAPPPLPSFLYLPDPEEVPAGVLRQLDEQYWQVYTPPPLPAQPLYLPDPEEVPAGSLHGPFEEDALPLPPTRPAPLWVQAWTADDEIVPQPTVFGGEEEYWFQLAWQQAPTTAWVPMGEEEVSPQPIAFGLDEEYWLQLGWQPPVSLAWWGTADEEIVPQRLLDEDYWFQLPWQPQSVSIWVPIQEEEYAPRFLQEEDAWIPGPVNWQPAAILPAPWWDDNALVPKQFVIAGVTRDCSGAPLGSCTVYLVRSSDF